MSDIITIDKTSDLYPAGLLDLGAEAPETLWVRGNSEALKGMSQSVAVIGARASTGYGEHITMELVSGLLGRGATIVNGGGYGIEGMAARAALAENSAELNAGERVIVWLAGGVDRLYPSGHDALFQRVLESGGVIVSAQPEGYSPTKQRFIDRSRYLGYTTSATVVVEAGWRSGCLRVAQAAHEAGNFVGAVPGPVTSASSAGTHELIRTGIAELIVEASQVGYRLR